MGVKDDMSGLMSGGEFIGIELMEGIELSKVSEIKFEKDKN